jgi:tRNA (cmo5U34)-methyltransferase
MSVQHAFDRFANIYDQSRRQLVPHFDAFYGTVLEIMDFLPDAPLRILDLGAGTGLLSMFLADAYPQARIVLMDIAGEMLQRARDRFKDAKPGQFEYVQCDYANAELGGDFDVIASALSIHHLTHDAKRELFSKCLHALKPGGLFINAEQILGDTPAIEIFYREAWLKYVRGKGASEADIDAAFERMKEDKSATLADQLEWLQNAGFEQVNCWYQHFSLVVYSGTKPA